MRWATAKPLRALDIGGRDINGNPRHAWPLARWTVVDLYPGPGVHVVADAASWLPPGPFDLVLCTEVFEHAPDWRKIIVNAACEMGAGAYLVVTCAGPGRPEHSGIDGEWRLIDDEHYANISPAELAEAMTDAGLVVNDCRQTGLDTQGCGFRRPDH